MADGVYVGGPITLANGSTAFSLATGTSTQVKAGDLVLVDGVTGVIDTFLTGLTGTLKQPWAGASVGVKAALNVAPAGANNDMTYTAVASGVAGNAISVAYVDPAAASQALSIGVVGNAITVNLATNGASAITSTAAQIKTAIDGNAPAAALVTVANTGGDTGAGIVTAMALANLAGGIDAKADYLVIHQGPYWSTPSSIVDLLALINTHISAGGNLYLTAAAPVVSLGRDEDFAFLIAGTTATIYHKAAGAWDAGTTLVGNSVTTGTAVPSNGNGADGDIYIRTSTGDVYTKTAGAWGIVAVITGGVGPIGPLAVPTFAFDNTAVDDSDPGSGKFKLNHATPLSATIIYVDVNEEDGLDVSAWLTGFGTGGTATNRGTLSLKKASDGSQLGLFQVTGLVVGTGYRKITGTMLSALAAGSWTNGASIGFHRSEKGDTGATGAAGVAPGKRLTFSTAVDDSDPGAGKVKANNATFVSITKLWIDDLDAAGVNIETWIQGLDDSTNATNRADMELRDATGASVYMAFRITGAVVDKTGYWEVPVTPLSGTIPTDGLVLAASAWLSGDDGATGPAGADGTDPGTLMTFDSSVTDAAPATGNFRADNAALGSATQLFVAKTNRIGNSIETWLFGLAASTGTIKGQLTLTKSSTGAQAIYNVTGVTDATGYVKIAVQGHSGVTAFTNADPISVQFARAGDAGAGSVTSVNAQVGAVVLDSGDIAFDTAITSFTAVTAQGAIDEFWASLDNVATSGAYTDLAGIPSGRNYLINPHGRVNQRVPASNADDTYGHDRWVALTQTSTIAVSTLSAVEDGTPAMMRLTQSQATAQRMGYAQVIEGANCKHLRGKAAVLGGRFRYSNAAAVRYAILEWTGTEDAVTSDVVNSWTSATFTEGNFFLAANLTVRAVGTLTPSAAVLTDLTALTATLGSTFNNLIVFIWTEGTAAQNSTLDLSLQFERGAVPTEREFRPIGVELALCQRYFERIGVVDGTDLGLGSALSTSFSGASFSIVPKRVAPSISFSDVSHFKIRVAGGAFVTGLTSINAVGTVNGQISVNAAKTSAFTASGYSSFQGAAAGYMNFDAEL